MALFFIEMTDIYGGEANYSWVTRFIIKATTKRGAMVKIAKETGCYSRISYDGEVSRYNVTGACICFFISETEGEERDMYSYIKEL